MGGCPNCDCNETDHWVETDEFDGTYEVYTLFICQCCGSSWKTDYTGYNPHDYEDVSELESNE